MRLDAGRLMSQFCINNHNSVSSFFLMKLPLTVMRRLLCVAHAMRTAVVLLVRAGLNSLCRVRVLHELVTSGHSSPRERMGRLSYRSRHLWRILRGVIGRVVGVRIAIA